MYSLEDINLVQNLATMVYCGTVVYTNAYQGIPGGILRGICFLPHVLKIYSFKDIELVSNLTTRAIGGTVVYSNA